MDIDKKNLLIVLSLVFVSYLNAQDFGFGDSALSDSEDSSVTATDTSIGGNIEYSPVYYFDSSLAEFRNSIKAQTTFESGGSAVDIYMKLNISDRVLSGEVNKLLDEAYVRTFLGPVMLEGGWLKVFWGKADTQGPLDVLNPYDRSDLTVMETRDMKIAQPMLHLSWGLGAFSTLEAVAVPGFTGDEISWDGVWTPSEILGLKTTLSGYGVDTGDIDDILAFPDTYGGEYLQGGFRFSTTIGSVDLGIQSFYGYLSTPVIDPSSFAALIASGTPVEVRYDRYLQLGMDMATVLVGFNIRSEIALDGTEDWAGVDRGVVNPFIAWSFGFDRILFKGVTANIQTTGRYRLMDGEITDPTDIQANVNVSSNVIIAKLTQDLFNDKITLALEGMVEIEDTSYMLIPNLSCSIGDAVLDMAVGLFGGDEKGTYGQFSDNSYLRVGLNYEF